MHRLRSIAARTPAIAIAGLAVVLSLGGGALASTHLVPGPSQGPIHTMRVAHSQGAHSAASSLTTGVTWQSLVLQNAWTSSNAAYGTGNPKVALQGNVVYLSGSMHQSTPGSAIFAFLPSTYRPTHNLYITVYTNGG